MMQELYIYTEDIFGKHLTPTGKITIKQKFNCACYNNLSPVAPCDLILTEQKAIPSAPWTA